MSQRRLSWLQGLCLICLLSTAGAQTYSRFVSVERESDTAAVVDNDKAAPDAVQDKAAPDAVQDGGASLQNRATVADVDNAGAVDRLAAGPWKPWYSLVSSDGYLAAKFSAVSPDYQESRPARASDVVLTRQGAVIGMAKIGPGGVAQIGGVRDGPQGLFARGADGFAAFGIYASRELADTPPQQLPTVDVGMVPLRDLPLVESLIATAGGDNSGAMTGPIVGDADLPGDGWMHSPRMVIGADGFVRGRVVLLGREHVHAAPEMDVFLIRDGKELASAKTDPNGRFQFSAENLSTGFVSLVVRGRYGFVVVAAGIERAAEQALGDEFVSLLDEPAGGNATTTVVLAVSPVPRLPGPSPLGALGNLSPFGGGMFGFGGTGGFGGGGGGVGGGGGGGLGALLAGLAGAGLGAVLAEDKTVISPPGP